MATQTAMPDPVAASYTNREYVGIECLWLEAVTLLLLSIGMLNACLEAKKLKESCAGVIGAGVLATVGLAAAVVIRLPCVPLLPNYDGLMQVRLHSPGSRPPTHPAVAHPRTHAPHLRPHVLTSPQSGSAELGGFGELGRIDWTRWSGVGGVDVRVLCGCQPASLHRPAPPCQPGSLHRTALPWPCRWPRS